MAIAGDIVKAALRKLRVIDAAMSLDPVDFETGRDVLNRMLARWEANSVTTGWVPVAAPTDTANMPIEAEEAVIANLAIKLQSEYGAEVDPSTIQQASDGLDMLRRDLFTTRLAWTDNDLPWSGGGVTGFVPGFIRYGGW